MSASASLSPKESCFFAFDTSSGSCKGENSVSPFSLSVCGAGLSLKTWEESVIVPPSLSSAEFSPAYMA